MSYVDLWSFTAVGKESPAENAVAVTPSDSTPLATTPRALWVGGAGNLAVTLLGDSDPVTFVGVPAGTLLPVRARLVRSTNTTATNIVAVW